MCKPNQRMCPNAWCIDIQLFCNGFPDCDDGFDELGCETNRDSKSLNSTCDEDEFACISQPNQCFAIGMKCDGKNDCPLGEDEKDCPNCPPHKFECQNGKCIVERFYCDGGNDCGDNSDEIDCGNKTSEIVFDRNCAADQFKCKDGTCLEYSKVCDYTKDCTNGDDEDTVTNGKCKTACKGPDKPCDGICRPSPSGAVCSCDKGFKLINGKYCEDIDECLLSPCSQKCKNLNGSFVCTCNENFTLASDRTTCRALGGNNFFLFVVSDQIRKFEEFPKSISVINTENYPIADIDVNVARNKIIYTLMGSDDLIEMDMENNTIKMSYEKVALASKIAHDWISGNTYTVHHADDMKVKINVCSMKTRSCAVIHSLDYHEQITAIRVDPIKKFIFYAKLMDASALEPVSKIIRMRLDGSGSQEIAKGPTIKSLAIDIDQELVYFTETLTQSLFVADYSGEQTKRLITQSRMIRRPIAMALYENHAFIVQQASQMISRCKLYGNFECYTFDILTNSVRQIVIGHTTIQKSGINNCANHTCGVVCIPSDVGFNCLSTNGTIVEPLTVQHILVSSSINLRGEKKLKLLFSRWRKHQTDLLNFGFGRSSH